MMDTEWTIKPFPPIRKATIDLLSAASNKHMIHGFIEVDITKPRLLINKAKEIKDKKISLTGYIIYCCAKTIDHNKHMHACRDWKNRLILFDEVDVSTTIERIIEGRSEVVPTIIRAANKKSILDINKDIRKAQSVDLDKSGVYRYIKWYLALPGIIRKLIFRILDRMPHHMKKYSGTVMVTSVGMFGSGHGWGLPVASHTLNITIGGIGNKVSLAEGKVENREYICITVSFDHDIIDGAPAARFIERFKNYVENGEGLSELLGE